MFALAFLSASDTPATPNLQLIGAPQVWAHNITGQGVVIALLDSGVDLSQPELAARWRGGTNSWFDPYNEHPQQPIDLTGHGTQVLGVIVGGQASGASIGLAPEAQWIAARIFNDRGQATTEAIHAALRWVLDPDGDPTTPDAPQVLNASWSAVDLACNPEFAADLRALREAGILPVFSAGTHYPVSPANLPEAFAVGALAGANTLLADSASGPSACPGKKFFPDVVAPGKDIFTTDRSGLYATLDGTSLAAAHVSGALALLLSAHPGLTADEQAALLRETAVDLGAPGPDVKFGYGRLNVNAAALKILNPPSAMKASRLMLALIGALFIFWWAVWRARVTATVGARDAL